LGKEEEEEEEEEAEERRGENMKTWRHSGINSLKINSIMI